MKRNLLCRFILLSVMSIVTFGASAVQSNKDYLCFTAIEGNSSINLTKVGNPYPVNLEYSLDGDDWKAYTMGSHIALLDADDKVYFRNASEIPSQFSRDQSNYYYFDMYGYISASGNVMSLIDSDLKETAIPSESCFNCLFTNCHSLVSAPNLPATKLKSLCYYRMFNNCANLAVAPALPATTLDKYCYQEMFHDCIGLVAAPLLPAETLATSCYEGMFSGCTSLTTAPDLPATTLAYTCYMDMFSGCTGLTAAPALPATTLDQYCYRSMFIGCTSLTATPLLPAETLVTGCYYRMFDGCSKLNVVRVAFTDFGDNTDYWLEGVASEGHFICYADLDTTTRGVDSVPEGWTVTRLDLDNEYVIVTYTEDGKTKKAYYKAADVEKIEWQNSTDIAD